MGRQLPIDLAADEHTDMAEAIESLEESPLDSFDSSNGAPVEPEPVKRPRASPRGPAKEIGPFGAIPFGATAWGIKRGTMSGVWEDMVHGDGAVEKSHWPLEELSEATIQQRWGAGTYRVCWYKPGPSGAKRFICLGSKVKFNPEPSEAAAATSVGGAVDPITAHINFMRLVHSQADEKIDSTLRLAAVLAGGNRGGISGEELRAIMRDEREAQAAATRAAIDASAVATKEAIAAAVAPLQAAIADMGGGDSEEGSDVVDAATRATAQITRKKGGFLGVLNFAAENPDLIKAGAPVIAGAFNALAELVRASQKASAVAAAIPEALPRAEPRTPPPPPVVQTEATPPAAVAAQEAAWAALPVDKPNGVATSVHAPPPVHDAPAPLG